MGWDDGTHLPFHTTRDSTCFEDKDEEEEEVGEENRVDRNSQ